MQVATLAMWMPGGFEWIVIGIVALLIFGRRLPDVARSVGKSIVEFKKGIRDVKDDIDVQSRLDAPPTPKLEPKSEPKSESSASAGSKEFAGGNQTQPGQ
ncbi:MAG: twin-arginine translocase TatA/TatE family subunit [Phycisphaerae bacterium]